VLSEKFPIVKKWLKYSPFFGKNADIATIFPFLLPNQDITTIFAFLKFWLPNQSLFFITQVSKVASLL